MERKQQNQFHLRKIFERGRDPNEPRVHVPLNPTNMVNQEDNPWCRCCQEFHDEDSCPEYQACSKQVLSSHEKTKITLIS